MKTRISRRGFLKSATPIGGGSATMTLAPHGSTHLGLTTLAPIA